MSEKTIVFLELLTKVLIKPPKFTKWDPGVLEQIKECNAVYRMKFPGKDG